MTRKNGKSPAPQNDQADPEKDESEIKVPPVPRFETRPSEPPAHMIVGDEFVAQTSLGELVLSLRIKERTIRLMEDLPQREQFEILLSNTAPDWVEKMLDLDHTELMVIRGKFFQAFGEWQGALLGESFGSSTS